MDAGASAGAAGERGPDVPRLRCGADPMRPVRIGPYDTVVRDGGDGVLYMESPHALGAYAEKITERLEHWASVAPDRTYLAERDASGGWRRVSYSQALAAVRSLAQ